jgi:hypothetical protein
MQLVVPPNVFSLGGHHQQIRQNKVKLKNFEKTSILNNSESF